MKSDNDKILSNFIAAVMVRKNEMNADMANDTDATDVFENAEACFLIHDRKIVSVFCTAKFFDDYFSALHDEIVEEKIDSEGEIRVYDTDFYNQFTVLWNSSREDKSFDECLDHCFSIMKMVDFDTEYQNLDDNDFIEINPAHFQVFMNDKNISEDKILVDDDLDNLQIYFPKNLQRISCPEDKIFWNPN